MVHRGARTLGLLLPLALLAIPAAAQDVPAEGARVPVPVIGDVVDILTGLPVGSARVTLRTTGDPPSVVWEGISDQRGRFRTPPLQAAQYMVEISALGYSAVHQEIAVFGPGQVDLRAELAPEAVELEPLVVTSRRRTLLEAQGFYDRREMRVGHSFNREEIEARRPFAVSDLIRTIPGVQIQTNAQGRASGITMRGGCVPDILIDGVRLNGPVTLDEFVNVQDLEGLEVYRGANAPIRFTRSGCGTILAWTREPGARDGRAFSWTRLGIGLGVLLLGLLATG